MSNNHRPNSAVARSPRMPRSNSQLKTQQHDRKVSFGSFLPQAAMKMVTLLQDATDEEQAEIEKARQLTDDYQKQLQSFDGNMDNPSQALVSQSHINHQILKLSTTNYMINVMNLINNRRLNNRVDEVQVTLKEQAQHVDQLNVEVEVQKKITGRLDDTLQATKQLLSSSIQEYRNELSKQGSALQDQRQVITKIYNSKLNQDLIADGISFGVCLYAVNSIVVKWPVSAGSSVINTLLVKVLRQKDSVSRQNFMKQVARLILLLVLMNKMKNILQSYGLHNQVGGFFQYFQLAFRKVLDLTKISDSESKGDEMV